jgi:hypothetical protein
MVLLENFGAEPLTVKLRRSNCGKFVGLLRRQVAQPMMPGIPKFRKESHPERAKDKRRPIYSHLLLTLSWEAGLSFLPCKTRLSTEGGVKGGGILSSGVG